MFCVVKTAQENGLGKLIDINETWAEVEYFDDPSPGGLHRLRVPVTSIQRKSVGLNTRVYTFVDDQWRIGRVYHDGGEGMEIRLADQNDVYLPYQHIFVRWKHPIRDPVVFLGQFITETPRYAQARSGFHRNYLDQHCSASGISGLLSSSIELESHQVDVVRRILTDHTQRYLLADEVGLGKTIEAGVIIRQTVLDDLWGHRILVLVPPTLVDQWRNELISRFGLNDYVNKSIFVLPLTNSEKLHAVLATKLSLLVIDEAHHLADARADQALYERVCKAARSVDRLLLLSATPILRNEEGFHRMLHLLDPVVYQLNDVEGFKARIENRQALAETVAALDPANALFMDAPLADLIRRIPNDPRLVQLTEALQAKLLEWPEQDDPEFCAAVGQLRAHISETYRLNRRILRNRRRQVRGLTPKRTGVTAWFTEDATITYLETALDTWRIDASLAESGEAAFSDFYWRMVKAILEEPAAIPLLCAQRLDSIRNSETASFDEEMERLETIMQAYHDGWLDARLNRLHQGLNALPMTSQAVIFCSNVSTADRVYSHLQEQNMSVARHQVAEKVLNPDWQAFLDTATIRFLVCDQHAEEGINLQGGNKVVVHFDLPLQPNRIEQRMGRFDRFGHPNPIQSYVLLDQGFSLQHAWFGVLDQGLRVFNRSISSLQYLVETELATLSQTLLPEGIEAIQALSDRLGGEAGQVTQELKLIDHQDALDQLSPLPETDLDDMFDVDADWKGIQNAMMPWIVDTLMFQRDPPLDPNIDRPFRLRYLNPDNNNGQRTLIPSSLFINAFLGVIDLTAPGGNSARPLSYPYANRRGMAVRRNIRPFRYGSEFIEAVKTFSDVDDRGRCFAMWRQVFNGFPPAEIRLCFRFDFVIEVCLEEAEAVLAQNQGRPNPAARSGLSRRADALFGPTVMQVWVDEEGDELPGEFVDQFLAPPYRKQPGCTDYVDKNLETPLMNLLRRFAPDTFANWALRCERMRDKALDIVRLRPELQQKQRLAMDRARAEDEIRYAQLQTRIRSLQGIEQADEERQFQLEQAISEALHRGIHSPLIKVDVAGAVFLTNEPAPQMPPGKGGFA